MRYINLPKNRGVPILQWANKYPPYKVDAYHPPKFYLLKNYAAGVDFICVWFELDGGMRHFLQLVYAKLIFYHAVLAPKGVLHIICEKCFEEWLRCLVAEVFGEGLQGRVIYSILDSDDKNKNPF